MPHARYRSGYEERVAITVVTWNVHGSAGPDLDAAGERLRSFDPALVALQEVQQRQARALARRLGWRTAYWSFKHWPIRGLSEGHALLTPHRLVAARTVTLSRWMWPWTYRRRIAQLCEVETAAGERVRLANCHLASDDAAERLAQARRLLARLQPDTVVVGDLNARPGSAVLRRMLDAGLRDAWAEANLDAPAAEGVTNWRSSDPDDRPTNRLDYVLVPDPYRVVEAAVPSADADLISYRRLSDHLPVRVELAAVKSVPASRSAPS
jgi:endonuclease/exonuclease/phosphatase family metal-dependent hydrolase